MYNSRPSKDPLELMGQGQLATIYPCIAYFIEEV